MKKLFSRKEFKENTEADELGKAIDALPGLVNVSVYSPNGSQAILINFNVENGLQDGLFFLRRCMDKRYWFYGKNWTLEVHISDIMKDNCYPTYFALFSNPGVNYKVSLMQAKNLVNNLNYYLNQADFIKEYNFDLNKRFNFKDDDYCQENGYLWIDKDVERI